MRELELDDAWQRVANGAAFVDLRRPEDYLAAHIPGSLDLVYEFGPGLAARARDCLPLDLPLIILDESAGDAGHAAASLQGKGFAVVGAVRDALRRWEGRARTSERISGGEAPEGTVLDVADPRAPRVENATRIPIERLWKEAPSLAGSGTVVVVAGAGVRAALAVGILERAGAAEVVVWHPSGVPARH